MKSKDAKKQVVIYSTPSCVYCNSAKEFFMEKGIEYIEHDVAVDIEKRNEMVTKSGQMGVPVISIGERVIIGFNRPVLEEALGAR